MERDLQLRFASSDVGLSVATRGFGNAQHVIQHVRWIFGDERCHSACVPGDEVQPADIKETCLALRDDPALRFETLIDLAGIDYLEYGTSEWKTLSATASLIWSRALASTSAPGATIAGRIDR